MTTSSHPLFSAKACKLGHTVVANLIDTNEHSRVTCSEIAAALNEKMGLDPDLPRSWDEDLVRIAVRSGAFDTESRIFADFRGRYGGVRDGNVEEYKKSLAKLEAKKAKAVEAE